MIYINPISTTGYLLDIMLKIAIIEDHQVLIDALKLMMQFEDEFDFVGSANTLAGGRDLIASVQPDVLLLDLGLPDGNGLEILPFLAETSPSTHVVVLTGLLDEEVLLSAVDAGVTGFLMKGCSLTELLSSIRKAAQGELVVPTKLLINLLKRNNQEKIVNSQDDVIWERLTPREFQILTHLAAGESNDDIATYLNIAPLTVRTHVRNLMSKLGVHSRLEAVAFGLKHGILGKK